MIVKWEGWRGASGKGRIWDMVRGTWEGMGEGDWNGGNDGIWARGGWMGVCV